MQRFNCTSPLISLGVFLVAKGIALTLGLNCVDSTHYNGWNGELIACESDAKDMATIAQAKGFTTKTLLTKDCTRANIIGEIKKATQTLSKGDFFLLTYSGHGSQMQDLNKDEKQGPDETWCLYDAQIVDDELNNLYSKFSSGVRILVASDSCFSGGALKLLPPRNIAITINDGIVVRRRKAMPFYLRKQVYLKNKDFYDEIMENPELKDALKKVQASVLLLSASTEMQESSDGDANSLFTEKLKLVWDNGNYKPQGKQKGYVAFIEDIKKQMPAYQTPRLKTSGKGTKLFKTQQPFSI